MTNKNSEGGIAVTKDVYKVEVGVEKAHLTKKITRLNALACNNYNSENFDIENAMNKSQQELNALNVEGGLQEMLAAQILSIHRLQQLSIARVIETDYPSIKQYYTNTAIKLANTFVQQANLLSRLQGSGGQKIIVEHVDVHSGGQAVVGNITGGFPLSPTDKSEK